MSYVFKFEIFGETPKDMGQIFFVVLVLSYIGTIFVGMPLHLILRQSKFLDNIIAYPIADGISGCIFFITILNLFLGGGLVSGLFDGHSERTEDGIVSILVVLPSSIAAIIAFVLRVIVGPYAKKNQSA